MSHSTKPVLFKEGMIRTLERIAELRAQVKGLVGYDDDLTYSLRLEMHALLKEVAPILYPWLQLMFRAGMFVIDVTHQPGCQDFFEIEELECVTGGPDDSAYFAMCISSPEEWWPEIVEEDESELLEESPEEESQEQRTRRLLAEVQNAVIQELQESWGGRMVFVKGSNEWDQFKLGVAKRVGFDGDPLGENFDLLLKDVGEDLAKRV